MPFSCSTEKQQHSLEGTSKQASPAADNTALLNTVAPEETSRLQPSEKSRKISVSDEQRKVLSQLSCSQLTLLTQWPSLDNLKFLPYGSGPRTAQAQAVGEAAKADF